MKKWIHAKTQAPHVHQSGFYSNNDLQDMIDYINSDSDAKDKIVQKLKGSDGRAILDVISDGYYERFDRYDSYVVDRFIDIYDECFEV